MNMFLIRQDTREMIALDKPVFRIGKEKSYVDYYVDDPAVSRSHCNIISRDGQYYLTDTNSTNHTYLNGERIASGKEILLKQGDEVRLGKLTFRFGIAPVETETGYQVFISFRNVDQDAIMAENLFHELRKRGINAFFSKYSIDEAARADYVDAIDEALDSALLLVAVGTSKKNLTSKWVKSEINQFRTLMYSEENSRRSLASYRSKDYPESELPSGIKSYQSFSDLDALVRFIEVFFGKDSAFKKKEEDAPAPQLQKNTSADDNRIQIGDLIEGKYRVLSRVGQGGMSIVYMAIDEKSGRQFAVKEFRGRNDEKIEKVLLNSFRLEAELMKSLSHPAIPAVYDVINRQDSMILVMDFISGVSLQQMLSDSGILREDVALDYARQLCAVLDYMHTLPTPVIYRDLKPANILVLPNGSIKVIDFGTARRYSSVPKPQDTACLGTIGYAAPEQFGGMGQSDARTDIYNLGATLYHLVTGKNPAEPPYEMLPIREVIPELSRGLEAIILKCTQRNPDLRYQSAKELLSALENVKKISRMEALRRPLRRKPDNKKTSKAPAQPLPMPVQSQYQIPGRRERMSETTVLTPMEDVQPMQRVRSAPLPPPVPQPAPVKPAPTPIPGFAIPGTPVPRPGYVEPVVPKPITPAPRSLADTIQKLEALDPDSQRIVRELIDKLSK